MPTLGALVWGSLFLTSLAVPVCVPVAVPVLGWGAVQPGGRRVPDADGEGGDVAGGGELNWGGNGALGGAPTSGHPHGDWHPPGAP